MEWIFAHEKGSSREEKEKAERVYLQVCSRIGCSLIQLNSTIGIFLKKKKTLKCISGNIKLGGGERDSLSD